MIKGDSEMIKFDNNSFDVLRLFSAMLIVLGHIVTHLACSVWRPILVVQQNWPGLLCLFTLTGYLIPASLERSKSKKEFLVKRVSRIYPELWCAFVVSFANVIIIGGGYGNLQYSLRDILVWIASQVTIFQFYTPHSITAYGVGNPNGSLWTISMELQVYVVIMLVYPWLKKQKKATWLLIGTGSLLCNMMFPFAEAYLPGVVFKLINVTFIPYAYIYLIGMYAYSFREELIPRLKKAFWLLVGGYIVWCAINGRLLHFSIGHYCNIVSGIFVCLLTLSAGYYFGGHKFKRDYSYSVYLYHMIVINVLVMFGMTGSLMAVLITYFATMLLSFVSTNYVAKGNRLLGEFIEKKILEEG